MTGYWDERWMDEMQSEWEDRLMNENAKLRELANAVNDFCEDFTCDDCAMRRDCDDNGRLLCDTPNFHALDAMRKALRELRHPDRSCGDCDIRDECHAEIEEAREKGNGRWNTRCLFERRIEERMRKLGIEAGE